MKKRLILCLVMILALTLGAFVTAHAADDSLKVTMELSTTTFTEPKDVTVTIQVTNIGETDMPGPVTLYYPNGKQVEEFGSPTLAVGSSKTWSGTWSVTQAQLDAGKLTFKMKYSLINDAGEKVNKTTTFYRPLTYTGAVASVEINRTITPTTAREGQEISITYDVLNTGNVDVTDVTIKENSSISSKKGTIASVPAGEKASYTFTTTMKKKNLTSSATITYKAGGKTYTEKKEEASIKYGEVKLTAALSADKKGGTPGEAVKLTLTLKNSGNVDYTNVTVRDALLGEVFTGLTVAAGKTVTQEKEIIISETADYQFTVTGTDASGSTVETATDRLSVQALDPAQKITLTVQADSDRTEVYSLPGTVKFMVSVTNNSTVEVKDVTVAASGVQLYSFPSILPGETREFTRDVSVSMAGQYRFDATVTNQLSEKETFQSNVIQISYAQPTVAPTEAPIVTPPMPVYEDMPTTDGLPAYVGSVQQVLNVLYWVFMSLAGVSLLLLAVGVVRRIQSGVASSQAQDHLERGSYRDYMRPAPRKGKQADKPEEPVVEVHQEEAAPAEDDGGMAEDTLRELYPQTAARMQRDGDDTAPTEQEEPAEDIPEVPAEESRPEENTIPRSRRSHRRGGAE
ncbi:MAG: CARDB domain-containing protein [Aristaeellaceae bacterium]